MRSPNQRLSLLLAVLLVPNAFVHADDEPPAERALPGQIGDDPTLPLKPVAPRDEAEAKRVEAMAWFMKGRFQQGRRQFAEALASYEKALELDPKAIEVYRAYVPLAFTLRKTQEAVQRALVLVELDPDNPVLMQQLGRDLARRGRLSEAIDLLEKATEAPSLDKRSNSFVSLNRDLSVLYAAADDDEKLADAYEVVFEALLNPDRFGLDMAQHGALERDRAIDYERMGEAFLDAKRIEKAATAFTIASDRRGDKTTALDYNLARLHLQTGNPRRAQATLEKYFRAKLKDKGRDAYELYAEILDKQEKSDQLVGKLEGLVEQDPENGPLLIFLGDQYVEAEKFAEAKSAFERAIDDGGTPAGHAGLAKLYRLKGEYGPLLDEIVASFEAALAGEIQPELEAITGDEKVLDALVAEGRRRLNAEDEELVFLGGLVLAGLAGDADRNDDAIVFLEDALGKAEPRQKSAVYDDLADRLIDAEKYDRAIELLNEAVKSVTDNAAKAQFLYKLSQAQELDDNTEAALETIGDARRLLPDSGLLHYQQGWIHYHARQWKEAERVFLEVLEQQGDEPRIQRAVRFSLSNVYVQTGEMRKAEEVLEVVLEAEPDDPSVNNDLGYLYADQGKNLEKAEQMLRKAVAAEPENAAYQDSMGWVLYRLGKFEEALEWLEKAVEDPDGADPVLWDHLADTYSKLGRKDDAVATWKKALAAFEGQDHPDEKKRSEIEAKLKKATGAE